MYEGSGATREMPGIMLWLDLALGCLLIWGAVKGYHEGWRKSACGLGGLLCAMLTALAGRAGLRLLWNRYLPVEEIIKSAVNSRLAVPVSGGSADPLSFRSGLPLFLWEALDRGKPLTASAGMQLPADQLVRMLGCIAAFTAGLFLWWGFFNLCGSAMTGSGQGRPRSAARWAGALIGLIRRCCSAALLTGLAAPLAWLCGFPPALLELERSLLAPLAWHFFACLGIWR